VSEFRNENRFELFEDRRRDNQVSQTSLKGKEAAIRPSAPRRAETRMLVSRTIRI